MPDSSEVSSRKGDHIRINLEKDVNSSISTGLEKFRLLPTAIPEIDLDDVDISIDLLRKKLQAPILISSMTGGTVEAEAINIRLAEAAQECGVAMGVGSQRAALEHPELEKTFDIRAHAPDIALFANLGAVQLNYGYGLEQCKRAVDMIGADALFLHLNALQEAVQPEGNTRFSGLLEKIEDICTGLKTPVFIKEVGWGISTDDALRFAGVGVAGIDVAGAGGTSWSQVEMHRIEDPYQAHIAGAFHEWGIPTANSLIMVRRAAPKLLLFASGGLRTGVEAAKCIALGAHVCGIASPFLKAASISTEETVRMIKAIQQEIKISLFACGALNLDCFRGNSSVIQSGD